MKIIQGSQNPVANAAVMLVNAVMAPGVSLGVTIPSDSPMARANKNHQPGQPWRTLDAKPNIQSSILASSVFMWVLLIVTILTVMAGIAYVVMAVYWTIPTAMQQTAFDRVGNIFTLGFGALVGLLGGKTIR